MTRAEAIDRTKETTAQFAQQCLDLRGYVVIGSTYPLEIGSIETLDDQPGTATDAFGMVVSKTDRADMIAQLEAVEPWRDRSLINCSYFYRVVAE